MRNVVGQRHGVFLRSRYAPDSQNRQYALRQKIMMPVNPWCELSEVFESGMRAWEHDGGELERASRTSLADAVKHTVMMSMTPTCLKNNLQLGTCATVKLFETLRYNGDILPAMLEHP